MGTIVPIQQTLVIRSLLELELLLIVATLLSLNGLFVIFATASV